MQRRSLLVGLGTIGASGLAGCTGDDGGEDDTVGTDDTDDGAAPTDAGDGSDTGTMAGDETKRFPDGLSETGIEDGDVFADGVREQLLEATGALTFEPILTSYARELSVSVDGESGSILTTIGNQDPGGQADDLHETVFYSPPEDPAVFAREEGAEPEMTEGTRADLVAEIVAAIVGDLEHFTFEYVDDVNEGYRYDIVGFTDSEGITGTGVSFDEFESGQAVFDPSGLIVEHRYTVTDSEADETVTVELGFEEREEVTITEPSWVEDVAEEPDATVPSRYVVFDAPAAIDIVPAEGDQAGLVDTVDGRVAIVFDPDGQKRYNEGARTEWTEVFTGVNRGSTDIESMYLDVSVSGTSADPAHEEALSFVVAGDDVAGTGSVDILGGAALGPGEEVTVGLVLDLMASGISDLEAGAEMVIEVMIS